MRHASLPIERRLHQRSDISIECTLKINNGPPAQGRTRDISLNGVAIVTRSKARQGDMVEITFDNYGRHSGKVSRVFDGGFAVESPGPARSLAALALSVD